MQKNKKKAYHPTVVSSTPPVQLKTSTENLSSVEEEGVKKQPASKANVRWNIPKTQTITPGSVATQESKKSPTHFALPLSVLSIGRVMAFCLMEWGG